MLRFLLVSVFLNLAICWKSVHQNYGGRHRRLRVALSATTKSLDALMESIDKNHIVPEHLLFKGVSVSQNAPSSCHYLIANPAHWEPDRGNTQIGMKPGSRDEDYLPVLYIAEKHTEYGTLGYVVNNRDADATVESVLPSLRYLRDRPLYEGGPKHSGAALTMVHGKVGFPENRPFRGVPGKPEFKLFFSPDVAMANELCSSKDALPSEFKFFRWSVIWPPGRLEAECSKRRESQWIVLDAPPEVLFADDDAVHPLHRRLLASLRLAGSGSGTGN